MLTSGKSENQEASSSPVYGLLPRLGLFTVIMVVMGNMIGSGVFKKAAPMAADVQSPGLLLACWIIAGVVSLLGALSNAEVAGLIADPGGYYTFFKKMYGRAFAFIFGWSSFTVMQSASVASIAYVFGESANALFLFPRLPESWEQVSIFGLFFPFENFGVKAFTIATLLLVAAANYCGVIFGGLIANITTAMKLAGIALIVFLGLSASDSSLSHLMPLGPAANAQYGSMGLFGAMFAAMLGAFWAFDGWNNINSLGGEVQNPKRNIPLALGLGVAGVIVVYLLVNLAYVCVLSIDELKRIAASENGIAAVEAMRKGWGPGAGKLVAVLILVSTFGAVNCQLMPTCRTFYAMSLDGLFFRSAARCHPRYRTPSAALIMESVWASILVLSGTFDQLTDMIIFASFIFYGAAAFGVFVLRRTMKDTPRPYRVTGYPVTPALFVLFCVILVGVTVFQRPREAGIGLALMCTGWPFYFYWGRQCAAVAES